jgi:hypothetical protein
VSSFLRLSPTTKEFRLSYAMAVTLFFFLRACCIPSGVFPVAKVLLCIFHLLIKNYDDKFGYALRRQTPAPWFQFFKNALMSLRNCESVAEFTECKNCVLRVAAGWQDDDFPKTDTLPRVDMYKGVFCYAAV